MRLGQLARKLSLRPAQIVEFLAGNSIHIEDNSNTRIDDQHVELIVRNFAPESLEQIVAAEEEIEEEVRIAEAVAAEPVQPETPVVVETIAEEGGAPVDELPDVIRVQKIELSGLKVLGKIELPEPKKKESAAEATAEGAEQQPATEKLRTERPERTDRRKPKRDTRERSHQRSSRNPVELQREREARQAEEKRKASLEQDKARKKQHYEQKRKSFTTPKREKLVKVQPVVTKKKDTRPVPKTWFGKFLRWWTT